MLSIEIVFYLNIIEQKGVLMRDLQTVTREKLRSFRVIHWVMLMASIGYGVMMVYIHLYAPIPPSVTDGETLNTLLYGIIAYIACAIVLVKVLRQRIVGSDKIFLETEAMRQQKIEHPPFYGNYLSMLFILWSILEVIAIGGILFFLVSGDLNTGLIFVATAVLLKFINGPKYEELNGLLSRHAARELQG